MSTNESARHRGIQRDMHLHEDPPDAGGAACVVPGDGSGVGIGEGAVSARERLWRRDGVVVYGEGEAAAPVRVVWARPLSDRGGPVSLLAAGKNREVAYIPDLTELDAASRRVAVEELGRSMVLPVIKAIREVRQRFGNYYWDVETDLGPRRFLFSAPENNSFRAGEDSIVIRDVSGNCYEIASISSLDKASLNEMERVL